MRIIVRLRMKIDFMRIIVRLRMKIDFCGRDIESSFCY